MVETIAHIACKCGQKFQVLKTVVSEDGQESLDIDEEATAKAFSEHECS